MLPSAGIKPNNTLKIANVQSYVFIPAFRMDFQAFSKQTGKCHIKISLNLAERTYPFPKSLHY